MKSFVTVTDAVTVSPGGTSSGTTISSPLAVCVHVTPRLEGLIEPQVKVTDVAPADSGSVTVHVPPPGRKNDSGVVFVRRP